MDKTPQIAEEKLDMTMDKAQKAKLQNKVSVSLFSADISKSEDISRWRPIDKALLYDFSATKTKNSHNFSFIGKTHVLSSNGFNKKRNEAYFSKIMSFTW